MRTTKTWNTWRLASHLQRVAVRAALGKAAPLATCKKFNDLSPAGQAGWLAVARDVERNTIITGYRDGCYRGGKQNQ